jgi:transcriptional regulator with XRE-family HTH domain
VSRSYVTNLRKGRIENPGYEKMRMMAKAMGFPPEAWFEDISADGLRTVRKEERGVARRVEHTYLGPSCTRGAGSPTRARRWPA